MKIPNTSHGPLKLTKIDFAPRLSQETLAFAANIEVNGLKGHVQNDGHGGSNHIFPREVAEAVEAYARTLPPCRVTDEWGTDSLPYSANFLISEMIGKAVEQYETTREHKKMAKKGYTHYTVVGNRTVYSKGAPSAESLTRHFGEAAKDARIAQIAA